MIKVENMLEKYGIKLENGLETKIKDAGIDSFRSRSPTWVAKAFIGCRRSRNS